MKPTSTAIEAVIFDMDGVLLDSERLIYAAWQAVTRELGYAVPRETYLKVVGRHVRDVRRIFVQELGEAFPLDAVFAAVGERLQAATLDGGWPVKPGVRELLHGLQERGLRLAVASSTLSDQVASRLLSCGLRDYFDVVCGGDQVERGKPEPDLFLHAAARLGVAPERCAVVEDSPLAAAGAQTAGMTAILVPDMKPASAEDHARVTAVVADLFAAAEVLQTRCRSRAEV